MCENVPPLALFNDPGFARLRTARRNAVVQITVRLHQGGDGEVPDDVLRGFVRLSSAQFAVFANMMIHDFGWLKRAENGCLCRAGVLLPGNDGRCKT